MATTISEPVNRLEMVDRPYPGEKAWERVPGQRGAAGPLLGRILLSQIFLASGVTKIMGWAQTQGFTTAEFKKFFESASIAAEVGNFFISAVPFLLVLAIIAELAAGLALLVGFRTRLAAFVLFAFLIPTTIIFHSFWRFPEAEQQLQTISFMKNLAIMGGLAMVMSFGPGRISLDARKEPKEVWVG